MAGGDWMLRSCIHCDDLLLNLVSVILKNRFGKRRLGVHTRGQMADKAYENLLAALRRNYLVRSIGGILGWDQQVNLPPGSAAHRGDQIGLMAEIHHREATRPEIGEWLSELEGRDDLSDDQRVVLRWARRDYDRLTRLPASFVQTQAEHEARAYHAWAAARKNDDFASFAPFLERTLELAREEAGLLGQGDRPYDYHIDLHDPGMTAKRIESLFSELKAPLLDLVRTILDSSRKADLSVFRGFDISRQRRFIELVLRKLGFDFNRGRLDESLHPFCGGDGADTRMTTRFDPDNPLDALFSSIHETGHAIYGQQLPMEHRHTALGHAAGMAVHESQSRLWENQVCRSRPFWRHFEPVFRQVFSTELAGVSSDDLYLAINAVHLIPIRVDSDEVTYNLHILLRFELEKALFDGSLAARDLPAEWGRKSEEIVGLRPRNDREGVLQDIHWSGGSFGYFPSYCLGNMMAAQLWYALRRDIPDLDARIAAAEFAPLRDWLREKIHVHGRRYDADELVRRATGEEFSPQPLLRYLRERYLSLYNG